MTSLRAFGAGLLAAAFLLPFTANAAEDTIKIGVLHSLSGTMAISETTLKDTVLMMVDEPQATKETHGFITAGWTAAPAVSRVIAQIAPLMGLMPKTVTPSPVMAGAGSITIKGSKEVAAVE